MIHYFPSCNYTRYNPVAAIKLKKQLKDKMKIEGCCTHSKESYDKEDLGLYFCQACREHLESKISLLSLWVYLDQNDFPLPDYHHQKMYLQDCFRDQDHFEIHQAVRSLLKKMNIDFIEINNGDYCGTLHYQSKAFHYDTKLSLQPLSIQEGCMKEHFEAYQDYPIITYCNRCLKGVELASLQGYHLLDLIMNEKKVSR